MELLPIHPADQSQVRWSVDLDVSACFYSSKQTIETKTCWKKNEHLNLRQCDENYLKLQKPYLRKMHSTCTLTFEPGLPDPGLDAKQEKADSNDVGLAPKGFDGDSELQISNPMPNQTADADRRLHYKH